MLGQPTPNVSSADLERIIEREFPNEKPADVRRVLEEYGTATWHSEIERVQLAILKLAQGDIGRLRQFTDVAKTDYRDVLGSAEYPGFMKDMMNLPKLDSDARQQIVDADWRQYSEWFERKGGGGVRLPDRSAVRDSELIE